jgi:hypothetical protein
MSKYRRRKGILKLPRENWQFIYKDKHVRITSNFSAQTLKDKKAWSNTFKVLKAINY